MSAASLKFVKEITIKFSPWNPTGKQARIVLQQVSASLASDKTLKTELKVDSDYESGGAAVHAVLSDNSKLSFDCASQGGKEILASLQQSALALDTSS